MKGKKNPNYVDIQKEELEKKIVKGLTSKELANYFDVNQNTITSKVKKFWNDNLRSVRKKLYKENHKYGSCKICGDPLKQTQNQYCSNECKFSDDDYNKSRKPSEKNKKEKKAVCKKCDYESKDYKNLSGALTKHKNEKHENCEVEDLFDIIETQKTEYLECPKCEWKTKDVKNTSGFLTKHIKNNHENILKFVRQYPEIKNLISNSVLEKEKVKNNKDQRIKCQVCGKYFKKLSNTHLKKHGLTPSEYKQKYNVYNLNSKKTNDLQSSITRKMNFDGKTHPDKKSSYEKNFSSSLENVNIDYKSEYKVEGKKYDFYLPDYNLLIEIDGKVYHLPRLENLDLIKLNFVINDCEKNQIAKENGYKLKRLRYDEKLCDFGERTKLFKLINEYSYEQDYNINYKQKIIKKGYFQNYIDEKGKEKLGQYISTFLRFLRTFHPDFPTPSSKYSLNEIRKKIKNYDFSRVIDENKIKNNTWYIGNIFLKSKFKSYWKSSFKGRMSPVKVWNDDKKMYDIIKYRIGCNDHDYIGDFSLREIIKGIASNKYTVSFFKPLVAASIYQHFLGDVENPTVLDPCAGFGGRMLGFKSIYPNGTYIGIEPNNETYKELKNFSKNFSNIKLYNKKLENYDISNHKNIDLSFTSIPYYDTEIYSEHIFYDNFDEWKKTFISKLKSFPKLLVNIPQNLENLFSYESKFKLVKSVSHFDQKEENFELLLKCFE